MRPGGGGCHMQGTPIKHLPEQRSVLGGGERTAGMGGTTTMRGDIGGDNSHLPALLHLGGQQGTVVAVQHGVWGGGPGGGSQFGEGSRIGRGGHEVSPPCPCASPPPPKCSVPPELADSAVPWVEGGGLGPPTGPLAQRTRAGGGGCSRNCLLGSRGRGSSGGASAEPERNLGCNGTGEVGKRGVSCGVGGRGGEARPHGWRGSHLGGQRGGHVGRQRAAGRAQL